MRQFRGYVNTAFSVNAYAINRIIKGPPSVNNEEVLSWLEPEKMIKKNADDALGIIFI